MALRDTIFDAHDCKLEPVEVPEWGCSIWLRELTVADRAKILHLVTTGDKTTVPTWLVLVCACDQDGKRLFTDADFASLAKKNAAVIDRLAVRAGKLNGLHEEAEAEAKKD